MTIPRATATLVPIALMALLAACERPHGPPPPKAETANVAGQAAPSTVALSGTILDPQPDPVAARPASAATGTAAATADADAPALGSGWGASGAESQALRDFRAEQEHRDRELLDQDLSEAQLRAREDGNWSSSDEFVADELPPDDEFPIDEPLYEDEAVFDDGYDPPGAVYRP
jgi:hypothetical protein